MKKEDPCPKCGENVWKWIPGSLAQYCKCGYVRVSDLSGKNFEEGASIQQWAADLARAKNITE